jgi:hypothetical protein
MVTGKQPISSAVRVPVLIALAEVRELVIGLAKVALVIALAVAELERGPEAVEPVPNQPHAQLVVPPRTKSVTGPRRHDQVLLLMVGDLAAEVMETTRDPAATEAAIAWAAAE